MGTLFVGTTCGLYRSPYGDGSLEIDPVGFADASDGAIRTPVVADVDDRDRLFVATTRSGVWRSDDGGRSWSPKNHGLIYKEVWWLEQHPVTGDLYAGTGPVALFRSRDRAETWEEIEPVRNVPGRGDWFLHISPFFARVRTIALVPENPDAIYCAIEEGWVIRSLDGGLTWENLRDAIGQDSHVATLISGNPKRVLAATYRGVYLSDDAGDRFTKCEQFDTNYVTELHAHPRLAGRVFGAGALNMPGDWRTDVGANTTLYVSDDAGDSWRRITDGVPNNMHGGPRGAAIDPDDPDTYLVGTTDGDIWATRDGGRSGERLASGIPGWVTSLAVLN